ncbi:hypothetical protein F5Y17DRAFT_463438 [Xylariaceae sp. FL0594]|nr:hypothetical protein F5Y17DRAFT_463438 [Xylariaceae sp. FL0594]
MAVQWLRRLGFLLLLLHLYGAVAGPLQMAPVVEVSLTITTAGEKGTQTGIEASSETTSTPDRVTVTTTTQPVVTSSTAFPSALNGNNSGNNTSAQPPDPIPAGKLPLQPRLTPGWGVAGALLLISGIAYTLIGIKNAWLYTFLSAALLAGLSVTVLIVYVMVPPIPDAIQGGYVVAAVATGLILGGAATLFRELTEGLGCLLGGFCVSMWLLTLKPGGLLSSVPSKALFIAAFSAGSYAFYFSRYTRPYALMGLMSFAGATVTVVGIDSFSKAGLKEFWAYVWDLNHGLFPYGADTYPLTRGIRVELALTVVFTVVGIVSQLKLWRLIKERRDKKVAEEAEEQRKRDADEANLGLQIEEQNAKERQQWETVYGNPPPRPSVGSGDSGVGAVEEEKKLRISESVAPRPSSSDEEAEPAEFSTHIVTSLPGPVSTAANELMTTNPGQDNRVIIRVSSDDHKGTAMKDVAPAPEEKTWIVGGDGEARRRSTISVNVVSEMPAKGPGPEITPLPFKIPDETDEDDDNRSSAATYADEDDGVHVVRKKLSTLSITNRLSAGSSIMLRNLSRQSAYTSNQQRNAGEFGGSTEELVEDRRRLSDAHSMAATIGGLSLKGDVDEWSDSFPGDVDNSSKEDGTKKGDMALPTLTVDLGCDISLIRSEAEREAGQSDLDARPTAKAENTASTDALDSGTSNISCEEGSEESSSADRGTGTTESANDSSKPTDTPTAEATPEGSRPSASTAASTVETRASLTKDRLPSALPRVALSYRTNEWAKHLSEAEAPPLEQLKLKEYPQTPEGIPSPALPRSPSSVSNLPRAHLPVRSTSQASARSVAAEPSYVPSTLAILTEGVKDVSVQPSPDRTTALNTPLAGHSFRGKGRRQSNDVYIQPIQEEHGNESVSIRHSSLSAGSGRSIPNPGPPSPMERTSTGPGVISYSSPQTLLGKREMLLRNKSQIQLLTSGNMALPLVEHVQYNAALRPASQLSLVSPYNHLNNSRNMLATCTPYVVEDPDDMPLSQRKQQLIRQNSMLSVNSQSSQVRRSITPTRPSYPLAAAAQQQTVAQPAAPITYESHLPHRRSTLPSQAARDARLSNFRQSVAADMKAKGPPKSSSPQPPSYALFGGAANGNYNGMPEMERTIDQQRNALLTQREQEAQRKEMERAGKERNDRAFEELMRRGDLMDAHREALKRMQGAAKT